MPGFNSYKWIRELAAPVPELVQPLTPRTATGALTRIRAMVVVTLVSTVVVLTAIIAFSREDPGERLAFILTAAPVVLLARYWDRRAPWWAVVVSVVPSFAFWVFSIVEHDRVLAIVVPVLALGLAAMHVSGRRILVGATILAIGVVPVLVGMLVRPDRGWLPWLLVATSCALVVIVVVELNRISWRLTLQLEAARQVERELATVQERYRLASELHDIQGHTLHTARLTIQLARRLIDSDPTAAAVHLASAEDLVGEALADTRQIITAERDLSIWRELASGRSIAEAAGIEWSVDGSPDGEGDELFAVMIREATTNLLRHAHSTTVRVHLSGRHVSISNDGANGSIGPLGGLAVLSRRFEDAGGSLSTDLRGGTFTLSGRLP